MRSTRVTRSSTFTLPLTRGFRAAAPSCWGCAGDSELLRCCAGDSELLLMRGDTAHLQRARAELVECAARFPVPAPPHVSTRAPPLPRCVPPAAHARNSSGPYACDPPTPRPQPIRPPHVLSPSAHPTAHTHEIPPDHAHPTSSAKS